MEKKEWKKCHKCRAFKCITSFNESEKSSDGYRYECKKCQSLSTKQKRCLHCDKIKPIKDFYQSNYSKNSYSLNCKKCSNQIEIVTKIKKSGYVYIVTNPAWNGWVKIGRSITPNKRLNGYQVDSPFRDYEMPFSIKVDNMNIEQMSHQVLIDKKIINNNEWFKISVNNAIKVIMETISNN